MATLVANNSEASLSRVHLQPGINTVGRAEGNHHVIPHHSVSSRHCEIVVSEDAIALRDLGSTNGTFVDDKPIQQTPLVHGQRVRLGSVEFVVEAPTVVPVPRGPALRVNLPRNVSTVETAEAPPVSRTASEAIAAINVAAYEEPGFYSRLPGAFAYPLNKSGLLLLALGTVFFLILALALRLAFIFRLPIQVFTLGYLFAYMQRIISSSALGEDEVPDFPDVTEIWSDIILPFLLFTGTSLVSFAPVLAVAVLLHEHDLFWPILIAVLAACGFYFPMALLAVGVTDRFLALSPHIVVPSILRVLAPYLVACLVLATLAGLRFGMAWGLDFVPIPIVPSIIDGFVSLYFLIVEMRILGLLFRSYRHRLGWL
jgi:hypothetical protein